MKGTGRGAGEILRNAKVPGRSGFGNRLVDLATTVVPRVYRGVTEHGMPGEATVDPSTHRHGPAREGAEPPEPLPLPPGPYELRVTGLRTRWPDGEVVTFGDADLLLPAGRKVALVARSRVGTSALAAVLLRFLDYEGSVTLNDVELRDLSGDDVRRVIGRCARDTRVLPVTVEANVRAARPDAAEEEVADAMRRAGLGDPPGALAGDSGTERQRIALARALLADLPVLIMDEPQDGPAGEPADTVLAELLAAAQDRTLLLVTHRAAIPGAAPILRHVDEVVSLSGP
jgi:ABC-type transport system involved in cytochrome bd biosynthesis fused ATPase/permease subunit